MSIFEFDDQQGVRTRGTLRAPGATPGDVLTVGTSRGTVTLSPGGGSQPTLHKVTVTAAEITAAWDGVNNQAVITTAFMPDGWLVGLVVGALPDSLPANMAVSAYAASDTGFSAPLADSQAINASDIGYQTFGGINVPSFTNAASAFVATREGAVCDGTEPIVLFVTGDAAPVSGSADIYFIVWPLA